MNPNEAWKKVDFVRMARRHARRHVSSGALVKLEEELADTAFVAKRPRSKFLHVRDPVRRETLAFRVGFPVLGAVVAVTFAWLITQV